MGALALAVGAAGVCWRVMRVGIGLPSTIPGVDRDSLLEWARRAEGCGFSSLGTIDRIVYPNFESWSRSAPWRR